MTSITVGEIDSLLNEKERIVLYRLLDMSVSALRGEHRRTSQGNACTINGFSNWKKQYQSVEEHREVVTHKRAKVVEALLL